MASQEEIDEFMALLARRGELEKERRTLMDREGLNEFFYVYVLELDNGEYCVGHTETPLARFTEHAAGIGAVATKDHNFRVKMVQPFGTLRAARYNEGRLQNALAMSPANIAAIVEDFERFNRVLRPEKTTDARRRDGGGRPGDEGSWRSEGKTFFSKVGIPLVPYIREKSFFGKPFVRTGPLFSVAGLLLFKQGGALGYGLRAHPGILGILLGADSTKATGYVDEGLRDMAERRLRQAGGQKSTFVELYLGPELRKLGIEWADPSYSKALSKKVDLWEVTEVMQLAFHQGAGLGFHFPDILEECWDNASFSVEDWQEARGHGLDVGDTVGELSLAEAVAELARLAIIWAYEEAPHLLSERDFSVLDRLSNQPVEVTDRRRIDTDSHTPGQQLRRSRRRDGRGRRA